jgi:hypothetical protein
MWQILEGALIMMSGILIGAAIILAKNDKGDKSV